MAKRGSGVRHSPPAVEPTAGHTDGSVTGRSVGVPSSFEVVAAGGSVWVWLLLKRNKELSRGPLT